MRLTLDQDALIRDAAAATGQSLTELVTTAAVTRAEDTLADRVFRLDDVAWTEFNASLASTAPSSASRTGETAQRACPLRQVKPQQPRPIETTDNTADFGSDEESLDRYLADRALTNHLADLGRCYVCLDADTDKVIGYFTLSAVAVEHADLPGRVRRNAPNPVPAVLMGRLAIDVKVQGEGLGRLLLRDAILSTLAAADRIGVRILLVRALHGQVPGSGVAAL